MQNRSNISRTGLIAACVLSCAVPAQGSYVSASFGWAGNLLWNSEPAKIVRYTATGAVSGAALVGSYFAYNGGLNGNLTKVLWGGVIGGGLGMVCSQLYGVKASVKKIEGIVAELKQKMDVLSTDVHTGFANAQNQMNMLKHKVSKGFNNVNNGISTIQMQLIAISQALKNCATFDALEKVKMELLAFINHHAQDQKYELNDIKHKLEGVECSQMEMKDMLRALLARKQITTVTTVETTAH